MKLDHHQQATLDMILERPPSANLERRRLGSLLDAAGTTVEEPNGRLPVGDETIVITPPRTKDVAGATARRRATALRVTTSTSASAARAAAQRRRGALHADGHHLHEVEVAGKSPETPLLAILEVVFFLLPIAAVMLVIALVAAHYFG